MPHFIILSNGSDFPEGDEPSVSTIFPEQPFAQLLLSTMFFSWVRSGCIYAMWTLTRGDLHRGLLQASCLSCPGPAGPSLARACLLPVPSRQTPERQPGSPTPALFASRRYALGPPPVTRHRSGLLVLGSLDV